jgi:peptidoglycan hydrolase-like protein with peptidoglycan-binding domain
VHPGEVSLARLKEAAKLDPGRPNGEGTPRCEASVRTFENALAVAGFLNRAYVDGSYGTKTIEAVKNFQRNIGDADVDGIPGPLQLASLAARSGAFTPVP